MRKLDPGRLKKGRRKKPEQGIDTRLAPTRALVLCPVIRTPGKNTPEIPLTGTTKSRSLKNNNATRSDEAKLSEAIGLAQAIGLDICTSGIVPIGKPRPATLFGTGKVEEIRGIAAAEEADIAIVDHPLTPGQQRNLEKAWNIKVLDRTGLILEIFGERAQTREGRLQVELAHLTYQKSRLVRSWTHLERQRGGVGFLGGPGETQIEADRRALQDKIVRIRKDLEQVRRTRSLHRESRKRIPYPIVALVGYTNAGKSTLFNTMTGADVMAEDQVFATLDPTMRAIELPNGTTAILSDTVGFISNLPTTLVAAFRATLEEVLEADLILHVRDIASNESESQRTDVENILTELGIETYGPESRILEVWNKIDLVENDRKDELQHLAQRREGGALCISAVTETGLPELAAEIENRINASDTLLEVSLTPQDGALMSWLHENTKVEAQETDQAGTTRFRVQIAPAKMKAFERRLGKQKHNGTNRIKVIG